MSMPNRYTIIERLKTLLESITVAGGYNLNVAAVERVARIAEEVLKPARRPFIGIMPGEEVFEYVPSDRVRVTFTIFLTMIVDGANPQNIGQALSRLQDDVFRALRMNPRLGSPPGSDSSNVVIKPIRCGTSEGDANMLSVSAGYMEMELQCIYHRTFGGT